MKNFGHYFIHTYQTKIDGKVGWAYEIYTGTKHESMPLTDDFPTETFATKERAELAAIGHITLLEKGESHG